MKPSEDKNVIEDIVSPAIGESGTAGSDKIGNGATTPGTGNGAATPGTGNGAATSRSGTDSSGPSTGKIGNAICSTTPIIITFEINYKIHL